MTKHPSHQTALYWFRRSLRLDDNRALCAALNASAIVVPVFVLDPAILTDPSTGTARVRFLLESLAALDERLCERGSRLVLRYGNPVEELSRLVRETKATALFFSRDYEPYSADRDSKVAEAMRGLGVTVDTESDHLIFEPGEILNREGNPYTVFTPFRRVWSAMTADAPVPAPSRLPPLPILAGEPIAETLSHVKAQDDAPIQHPLVRGGEAEAAKQLDDFIDRHLKVYATQRDVMAAPGTSRLSAYLKFGVISARRVVARIREHLPDTGPDVFLSEICWRDFYYQILHHFPHVSQGAFKPAFDRIQWHNKQEWFDAWCEGRTGYPIVDAAQRQLNSEAWMHNRARMVTASFLTKDLLCDWRWGERYFMQKLIDGDLASNNGGWQWAAGTGTDAQPYFRIFNPVAQGERFDPNGEYVRRYVPELARVPNKYIHRPWELRTVEQEAIGCVVGRDYPAPIVDHAVQREMALALYRSASESKG